MNVPGDSGVDGGTGRETNGQRDERTQGRTDRGTNGQRDERAEGRTDRGTGRGTDRETNGQRDERTQGRTDRGTNGQRDERTEGRAEKRTDTGTVEATETPSLSGSSQYAKFSSLHLRGDESRFWSKKVPKRDFSFKEVLVYETFSVVSDGSYCWNDKRTTMTASVTQEQMRQNVFHHTLTVPLSSPRRKSRPCCPKPGSKSFHVKFSLFTGTFPGL